ncbi:MAG: hypothetical protein ACFCUE_15120 [Candidatus Bathyarchaeia archaeon]|jgi:hypothetical protein
MLQSFKAKSSIILVEGVVFNDTVKAKQCADCKCVSEILVANYSNPNLLLYGCKDSKCKNRLLRLSFDDFACKTDSAFTPLEN